MSKHSTTFVPLDTWLYQAPELRYSGHQIDIGLLCESLLYYDQVVITVPSEHHFIAFIQWFINQGKLPELKSLIKDEVINFYYYAFEQEYVELPRTGTYHLVNIQTERQGTSPFTFGDSFLDNKILERVLKTEELRSSFRSLLEDKVIEVKATDFDESVNNALKDFKNPQRHSLVVQSFLNQTYDITKWDNTFIAEATISEINGKISAKYNFNFDDLSKLLGANLNFLDSTPLMALARSNKYIMSASALNCDLYLNSPMSNLVGDKLYESAYSVIKSRDIIESLEAKVEFPDVRTLVNIGKLSLDQVLYIRGKSGKFRKWLQQEGDRDRDAIIAYHHEVAKESGYEKTNRIGINIFGVLSSSALGIIAETATAGVSSGLIGSGLVAGGTYLTSIIAKMGKDWKPVVFGNWMKNKIEKIVEAE